MASRKDHLLQKNYRYILLGLLLLIVLSVFFFRSSTGRNQFSTQTKNIIRQGTNITLKRITGGTAKTIASLPMDSPMVVRWKDELFYKSEEQNSLVNHNIASGNTTILFTQKDKKITYVSIAENTLFFVAVPLEKGAAPFKGSTYVVNLEKSRSPEKILDVPARVVRMGTQYFVISTEQGKECGVKEVYSQIEIATQKMKHIAEFGCNTSMFLAVDSANRILGANTKINNNINTISSIFAISLQSPDKKEILISEQAMPEGTTFVTYAASHDKLILLGDSVTTYAVATKTLHTIMADATNWHGIHAEKDTPSGVCIGYTIQDDTTIIRSELDIVTNTLLEKNDNCPQNVATATLVSPASRLDSTVKSLRLPQNYEVTIQ